MMKTMMKFSLGLNLVLAGGLLLLVLAGRPPGPESPPPAGAEARPPVIEAPVPPAAARPVPAPFRWHQLDSTNYHLYVNNLRAIGCPEPTLRAIVTADVQAVFRKFSQALEQQLGALAEAAANRPAGHGQPGAGAAERTGGPAGRGSRGN